MTDEQLLYVMKSWFSKAFEDLYVVNVTLKGVGHHSFFFTQQSVEKFVKAYIIAKRHNEFNGIQIEKLIKDSNNMVMKFGHSEYLDEADRLSNNSLKSMLNRKIAGVKQTEWELANKFDKFLEESRYPVNKKHHEKEPYRLSNLSGRDMFHSDPLWEIAEHIIIYILELIESDCGLTIPRENPSTVISERGWRRIIRDYFPKC